MKPWPFLALAAALFLAACSKLTQDNLDKVHEGMSPTEVKAILGDPTSSESGSALGLISGTTYVYHTDKTDVKISFVDDKVVSKSGNFQ